MTLVAWTVAAAALGVALGAVLWAQRASNSAPFRAHLAERDRQLDETQRKLDDLRLELDRLHEQLLDRESVISQLTGQIARERQRLDDVRARAIAALHEVLPESDAAQAIDLRETPVDDSRE